MFILSYIWNFRTVVEQKKLDIHGEGQVAKCLYQNLHRKFPPIFPTGLPTDLVYRKIIQILLKMA